MGSRSGLIRGGIRQVGAICAAVALIGSPAIADEGQNPHEGMQHQHDASVPGWQFMQDGAVFLMFNNQGGPRGETEVKAPNWWMGMGTRKMGRGTLTINLMLSLDPATVQAQGYSEIFQVGETYHGLPLIDHQHPHDFLMQAAASYRFPLGRGYSMSFTGAPVGDPALGPLAYMH